MVEKELRVRKIKEGTVIDHISPGTALKVLNILGIKGKEGAIISIAINVPTGKNGIKRKDIVKIENKELNLADINKIALISPNTTINIIRNFEVVSKQQVKFPSELKGIVNCVNPNCITNSREPIQSHFVVVTKDPISIKCKYCNVIMERKDILKNIRNE
ncbi:MAG: aspartate carbamoyltransferase regulatory subunit [Candidatus Helarchaeota archaeon]